MDWMTEEWKQNAWMEANSAWDKAGHIQRGRFMHGEFVADYIARAAVQKVCEEHNKAMQSVPFWTVENEDTFWATLK